MKLLRTGIAISPWAQGGQRGESEYEVREEVHFDLCTASEMAAWTCHPWGRCLAMAMGEVFVLIMVELSRLGQAGRMVLIYWACLRHTRFNLANLNQAYDGGKPFLRKLARVFSTVSKRTSQAKMQSLKMIASVCFDMISQYSIFEHDRGSKV